MTPLRKFLSAVLISAVAVGCSSTSKTSTDSGSTTSSSTTTTTVASGATTTTAASATTSPATTAKPVTASTTPATNPPATSPATTAAPQIITSFNVSTPSACVAPDVTFQSGTNPEVTVSWTVVGADSVTVSMDSKGGVWNNGLPLSGSTTVPASCDSNGHNQHTYYVIAIKGGQEIASKKATRGS